jgi:Protein of unknown function (DUF2934)
MAKPRKQSVEIPPSSDPTAASETVRHSGANGRDRIAMRAYELYLARGGADGGDFDDWLAAEREINGGGNAIPQRSPEDETE